MNIKKLPTSELGFFPTPVTKLSQLSKALDSADIFIKRDDLTGLALGGNKTRKLEYILGDAIANGCDAIITSGASQSNHCRQTAAAAAQLDLECHLILGGEEPDVSNGNLLLDGLFGAHIHWAGANRKGEDSDNLFDQLKAQNKTPYIVPYGGSNELGACGFVQAMQELDAQFDADQFSHIVFASSSGGTHAGCMVGKHLLKREYKLIGINIDKDEIGDMSYRQSIVNLANRTSALIEAGANFSNEDVFLDDRYIGEGYGVVGELEREAVTLMARHEGILLDPVYTGRAMGGLISMLRNGEISKPDKVLFWHTGGAPAVFAYADSLQ